MPKNRGYPPPHELVDIEYNSGLIVRNIEPSKRRWTIGQYGADYAYDIRSWQAAKGS